MRRRPPHLIELSEQDQQLLENLAHDGRIEQRVARRARILLAMADPETVVEQLADKVEITRVAIWQLCRRYEEQGLEAIFDAPRSGWPWKFPPVLAQTPSRLFFPIPPSGPPPLVAMMQPSDFADLNHLSALRWLLRSRLRRILTQR